MKRSDIDCFLNKYYEGLTSKEEEDRLLLLFKSGNVPDDLKEEQAFFLQLHGCDNVPEEKLKVLDLRLEAMIDRLEQKKNGIDERRKRRRIRLQLATATAASILLLLSLGMYTYDRNGRNEQADINEQTCARAQNAIMKFSSTLNRGIEQVDKANKNAEEIGRILDKYYCTTKSHKE